MFTVKVVLRSAEGNEKTEIHMAKQVDLMWDHENPTIRHVFWDEPYRGESMHASVGSRSPVGEDEMRAVEIFIENENGKTTEVIR